MASGLEQNIGGCEECGNPMYLRYKVGINKNLCPACYQQHHQDILPREDEDEQWICSYHDNALVVLFCFKCQCGICGRCINDDMHEGHERLSIGDAEKRVKENMKEALRDIGEEERSTLALKNQLVECQEKKAACITKIEQDVKQMSENEYKAINDTLAAKTDAIEQEFTKAVQELEMKRDAKLRVAEEDARERRLQSDEFYKDWNGGKGVLEDASDCRSAATLLHERRSILEKSKKSMKSILESNKKELLLMVGIDSLNTWKNEPRVLRKPEFKNIQREINAVPTSIERVNARFAEHCKNRNTIKNKNATKNISHQIADQTKAFLTFIVYIIKFLLFRVVPFVFLLFFQYMSLFQFWRLIDYQFDMDDSKRMSLRYIFEALHNFITFSCVYVMFISVSQLLYEIIRNHRALLISVYALLFLVVFVCSVVLHPVARGFDGNIFYAQY